MAFPSDFAYPRRVVVDDTDPRIKYESGIWTVDNDSFDGITRMGAPYNRTQHGTASVNASFSFQFEGEFVQVRGTKDNRKVTRPTGVVVDNPTQLAKWTCSIDGDQIQSGYYYAQIFDVTHNMLCEQSHLSHTLHTLSVNITLDNPATQMFWLDKIEYAPLPGANLAQEVLKFDASDPSIQFDNSTGAWIPLSDLFNATGTPGSSASVKFNGTSISIYTFNEGFDIIRQPSTGKYFIDSGGDTSFDIPGGKTLPGLPNNKTDWYNQLLFAASNIAPGSHEMTLTFTGVMRSQSIQWLSVDYFYVTASEGSKLNSDNPGGGGGGSGGGAGGASGGSSSKSKGAIIGGVVAGVVGLALIVLAILFFMKKRRRKANELEEYGGSQPQDVMSSATSNVPVFAPTGSYVAVPSQQPTPSHSDNDLWPPMGLRQSPMVVVNPSVSSSSTNQNWIDMKNAQRAAVESDSETIERQHHDSGIRYPRSRTVVDIPPTYTES